MRGAISRNGPWSARPPALGGNLIMVQPAPGMPGIGPKKSQPPDSGGWQPCQPSFALTTRLGWRQSSPGPRSCQLERRYRKRVFRKKRIAVTAGVHETGARSCRNPTMLTLYDYLPSQNAWKIRLLLNHLGLPHRTVQVSIFEGEGQSEAFRRINPTGKVPAIELDDGRTLAESNAILAFLADGSRYLPTDRFDRARVHQWLHFEQENIESVIGALRPSPLSRQLSRRPPHP